MPPKSVIHHNESINSVIHLRISSYTSSHSNQIHFKCLSNSHLLPCCTRSWDSFPCPLMRKASSTKGTFPPSLDLIFIYLFLMPPDSVGCFAMSVRNLLTCFLASVLIFICCYCQTCGVTIYSHTL
jgi:hypothetical protein